MRIRPLAFCVVLGVAALGAAGCTSGTPSAGATSGGSSAVSSPGASSSGKAAPGKPGGQVVVRSGGKVVCVITLNQDGTGTCKVSTKDYKPGQVTFDGSYNGDGKYKAGSASTTLTIKPAQQSS